MNALTLVADATHTPLPPIAAEPGAAWEARGFADLVPPATLGEARSWRDELAALLSRERHAAADFLLALADFDRRRGWERLGHASLFAFLTRELRLSGGAAHLRLTAARLLPRHPEVEAALRSGRLCLSAVGQLARVLTPANQPEVLPRFLGLSAREAQEVAAALLPCPAPPRREVVTSLPATAPAPSTPPLRTCEVSTLRPLAAPAAGTSTSAPLRTSEVAVLPRPAPPLASVEPLTADLRRLHLTVSARLLEKVAKARDGLSHAAPGATTEQVLEAALDLLLEQQARRKALVKRPRRPAGPGAAPEAAPVTARVAAAGAGAGTAPIASALAAPRPPEPPTSPAAPRRPHLPASIERDVRLRDGDRCQHPLDAGGVCGSTWQVELDHVVPLALGGPTIAANLRCACRRHNAFAAREALGPVVSAQRR